MKRVGRVLLDTLTALSLLLCASAAVTWALSYWNVYALTSVRVDHLPSSVERRTTDVRVGRGQIRVAHVDDRSVNADVVRLPEPQMRQGSFKFVRAPLPLPPLGTAWRGRQWSAVGFTFARLARPARGSLSRVDGWQLRVPLAAAAAGFALVPAARLVRFARRRRRLAEGSCCRLCSYDLTANVSGVCPECGAELPETGVGSSPPGR